MIRLGEICARLLLIANKIPVDRKKNKTFACKFTMAVRMEMHELLAHICQVISIPET